MASGHRGGLTGRGLPASHDLLESVGHFDIDLQRRDGLAAVEFDRDLVRIDLNVPRHYDENLFPQRDQKVRLTEQSALVREKDLQPLPRDGGGRIAAAEQPQQIHAHAALRPNNRFMSPLRSVGTTIATVSPVKRRAASK